jgi:hypothetical protein
VAIAHEGGPAPTRRETTFRALYQKECSIATARSN